MQRKRPIQQGMGLLRRSAGRMWPARFALETVLKDVEAHVAEQPGDAPAHLLHGCILRDLGRDGAAIDAYRRAISLDSTLRAARTNLGVGLHRLGHRSEARAIFEALAAENRPSHWIRGLRRRIKASVRSLRWPASPSGRRCTASTASRAGRQC
jgi:tetratricopeptide (TPR) repeat protein